MTDPAVDARARRVVTQRLESLQRAGVSQLSRVEPPAVPTSSAATVEIPKAEPTPMPTSKNNGADGLNVIRDEVTGCTLCSELAESRTQTVFGVGNPNARLCFFGEAPGADEDRQGEPFVGRAGKLLTDIIEKGMGLTRDDVYILNVLKCRPPGNRNPNPDEIANCRGFFERQLDAIKPEFICCLGSIAAHTLLDTNIAVGKLRGTLHTYKDAQVVVTYHPAYLLRNPSAKKLTWEDIQLLMGEMGLPASQ